MPAPRMKAGREHRVPLSRRALKIVKAMHEARDGDFVFPGQKPGKPLSVMALEMVLRRMKIDTRLCMASAPLSEIGQPSAPVSPTRFARPRLPM